ncbi:unnamed protein product [Cylindrotheca closterium]|uniref:indole-3-glycerol-phosphate synthase n=1 Tax=Cylindrotheca closterium TaxID=2856 RepID=A0AAD2FPK9_9STRA|nr:unnamed protein product [Cylindrotheca closterium]
MQLTLLTWSAALLSISYTAAFQPSPLQKRANSQHINIHTGSLQNEKLKASSPFSDNHGSRRPSASKLFMASASSPSDPQILASGYSEQMILKDAVQEAITMAITEGLPPIIDGTTQIIDLAIVSVNSLYDGSASPSEVVPTILSYAKELGYDIQNLVGSYSGGLVSSRPNPAAFNNRNNNNSNDADDQEMIRSCLPIEREGVPGVSVTLCILPDVQVQSFHVEGDDVPDDVGRVEPEIWKRAVGLGGFEAVPYALPEDYSSAEDAEDKDAAFFLLPSPAFQNDLDELLRGLEINYPSSHIFGAIASTVSSLSRARLFRYQASDPDGIQTLADGCLGVALSGDLRIKTMIAQGAKPVGGVYRIVKGAETTIQAIALDESATELLQEEEDDQEEEEEEEEEVDESTMSNEERKAKMAAAYAKARIPKPILAEANFLMKTLSDDDQSFMRRALLVGLERGGSLGRSPSELARLAEGKGHQYTVHQVASAGMKDGSVTLSLGSVDIKPGTRLRFFVRESDFAKKELAALWTGYKRRALGANLAGKPAFNPTGCFLFPTLDRGSKFFMGKTGYESEAALDFLPTVPCINGFFSNGVIGSLQTDSPQSEPASLYGSASGYALFGSKSGRPVYTPDSAAAAKASTNGDEDDTEEPDVEDWKVTRLISTDKEKKAPRDENGELILKRREIHSGRAMTVSAVEWSVAERTATPSSVLEGFMWDKENEVDRFRERVPLSNLVSQCKLANIDPAQPKPRDWVGPIMEAAKGGKFVLIPECKRLEPISGSLRKRYDIAKIVTEFCAAGAPAISVNCDAVLFGGSLEDITTAREASSKAALDGASEDGVVVPPVMASDLLLYPYQLYKMRLAGADAVNMIAGALGGKDMLYLAKISQALNMQALLSVTSIAQIKALDIIPTGGIAGLVVSNRNLEDFSFDMTGQQALKLLQSEELKTFREKQGDEFPVFVEGRVGLIDAFGEPDAYLKALQEAGATGAIVAAGVAPDESGEVPLKDFMEAS